MSGVNGLDVNIQKRYQQAEPIPLACYGRVNFFPI
jgi:hypothetical protein